MKRTRKAFTLVEMLIVIAIISVLAAMAISSFSNAAQDSREVLVRQQLAVFQEAANSWASRQIGKVVTGLPEAAPYSPNPRTVEQVRGLYNAAANVSVRLGLFEQYLDEATRTRASTNLDVNATTGRITTDAMRQTGYYLTLPTWTAGSYPKVQIGP